MGNGSIDTQKLRTIMLVERGFLSSLYIGNSMQNRRTLASSNNIQLKVLIQILHCIASGKIALKRAYQGTLSKSGRGTLLHKNFNKSVSWFL